MFRFFRRLDENDRVVEKLVERHKAAAKEDVDPVQPDADPQKRMLPESKHWKGDKYKPVISDEDRLRMFRDQASVTKGSAFASWVAASLNFLVLVLATTALILSIVAWNNSQDHREATDNVLESVLIHRNSSLRIARYLSTVFTLNNLHQQEFMCAVLLAECFDLRTNSQPSEIAFGGLGQVCKAIDNTCADVFQNQIDVLSALDVTPGEDYSLDGIAEFIVVPQQFTFSTNILGGLRFDRAGPASAQFGSMFQDIEKPLYDKDEIGMFIAFSYYAVSGTGTLTDGLCWINLDVRSTNFGLCTVILDTAVRAGVFQIYATQDRVFALGTDSNAIYWWDTSVSVALATTGATMTSAAITEGTFVAANQTSLSSPWFMQEFANGNLLVSMLDSNSTGCNTSQPFLCGGFMEVDSTLLPTDPISAISRWDSLTDGQAQTRQTPGEFGMGDAVQRAVVAGGFGSWTHLIKPSCFNLSTQVLSGVQTWSQQYNIFNSNNGQGVKQTSTAWTTLGDSIPAQDPRPFEEWRNTSGFIPNVARNYHRSDTSYVLVDTVGGAIISVTYAGTTAANPWRNLILAWVLPFVNPSAPLDNSSWVSPLLTDAVISNDDRFLYVAAYGYGQVLVFRLPDPAETGGTNQAPQHCATYQVTGGQSVFTGDFTFATSPGTPLRGAPANLALDPNGKFLYVSSSHPFDDCVYPQALSAGGFTIRFSVQADICNSQSLNIDPSFLLLGNSLPGGRNGFPARLTKMAFPAGDSKFQRLRRRLGGNA